jgi:hypothetical protein
MSRRLLLGFLSSILLGAAGCSHASGMRSAALAPNVGGGEDVDPTSFRSNTSPGATDPYDPRNPAGIRADQAYARAADIDATCGPCGTGSGPQQ